MYKVGSRESLFTENTVKIIIFLLKVTDVVSFYANILFFVVITVICYTRFRYTYSLGPTAFYKGFTPSAIRIVPTSIIVFLCFESLTKHFGYVVKD